MAENRKPLTFSHRPEAKTMFIVEGNKTAILVKRIGARRNESTMPFETPELALTWCRSHGSQFVYFPFSLEMS
jgi:hypothetical protein